MINYFINLPSISDQILISNIRMEGGTTSHKYIIIIIIISNHGKL